MMTVSGRRAVVVLPLVALLFGCGDDEASQRKAFMAFLKERIVDKPGVHVPHPTAEEEKSWGGYAQHYAIITGFNDTLSRRVSVPMMEAVGRGNVKSLEDIVSRRGDFVAVRQGLGDILAELGRQLAAAEAARAALKQPADLKAVYDAAFERDVTGLGHAVQAALPPAQDAIGAVVELGEYLDQHKAAVVIHGSRVEVRDPAVQRELNTRLTALTAKGQEVVAAQRRLRSLIGR